VGEHVVGMRRFLDPVGIHRAQAAADIERLRERPLLVGVQHDANAAASDRTNDVGAADVAIGSREPTLSLSAAKPSVEQQFPQRHARDLAQRSQQALVTEASASWTTPLCGPSQRNCCSSAIILWPYAESAMISSMDWPTSRCA